MTTRVALLRYRAVSRMDSAERWIETCIVSGLHRHDDNSWFVPSCSSGHVVVIPCVEDSLTCACAITCSLRHTTGMMYQRVFHDVLSNFADGRCHASSSVDVSDGRCLDGFSAVTFEVTLSLHLLKDNESCWRVAPRQHVNEGCRRERQCSNEGSSDAVAEHRSGRQRRILRQTHGTSRRET